MPFINYPLINSKQYEFNDGLSVSKGFVILTSKIKGRSEDQEIQIDGEDIKINP
jgi:hypothetical protein